jgi:predicted lipid-binding transport protein (Tim44 family)
MNQISYFKLGLTIVLSLLITVLLTALIGFVFMGTIISFADERSSNAPASPSLISQTVQQPRVNPQAVASPEQPSKTIEPAAALSTKTETITNETTADTPIEKVEKEESTLSESARETNIEICNFWKTDYEKTKSATAEKFRMQACERAEMSY